MPNNLRALRATAAVLCAVLSLLFFSLPADAAPSSSVVISQVYGSGGNTNAVLKNDFIELFNRGASPVSLSGLSVQYASATGTGSFGGSGTGSATQMTLLPSNVTLQPGQYFLIQEAGGSVGADLPSADVTGSINMSGSAGKVALVNSTVALGCNGGSTPCSTAQQALIVDLVGYGSANFYEGAAAPTLSTTTAALRAGNGSIDTDNNAADFVATTPSPRNSSAVPGALGVSAALSQASVVSGDSLTVSATVTPGSNPTSTGIAVTANLSALGGSSTQVLSNDGVNHFSYATSIGSLATGTYSISILVTDAQLRSATATISVKVIPVVAIHDIQGVGDASPYKNQAIQTSGIVTAVKSGGFFIQSMDVDADPNTSEGVYVYTGSTPPAAAAVGNVVQVRGTVSEYVPSADPFSPALTEISGSVSVTLLSTGHPLPDPVIITAADLLPNGGVLQLEKYEGMRVHVDALVVTGPTDGKVDEPSATSTSNGLFFGVFPGVARPFREAGIELPEPAPLGVPLFDANPERLRVDTGGQVGSSPIDVTTGAVVTNLTGVLDYGYRAYSIATDPGTPPGISGGVSVQPVPAPLAHEVTVASANLERFYDTSNDPDTSDAVLTAAAFAKRLKKVSTAVRDVLHLPDILAVEEMENLSTLQALRDQINSDAAAADPQYEAYLSEGNDIGGIDVGFLVKTSRVEVLGVTQEGKDATYLDPNSGEQAMLNDRPPLVLSAKAKTGTEVGLPLTVIVNHLRSLSSINSVTDGARVQAKRRAQAEFLADLIQQHQAGAAPENVISVGDYNAYDVNDGYVDVMGIIMGTPAPGTEDVLPPSFLTPLVSPALTDLSSTIDAGQRYSYLYDGNAQMLDHVLANRAAMKYFSRFAYARNNADFPEAYRNNPDRPERYSDHDVPVAYFLVPLYKFGGFVGLKSTAVNPGSTIPVKFQLTDGAGSVVSTTSAVRSIQAASNPDCQGDAEGTPSLATPAGGSTLRFDATAGQFVFNWQTTRSWTGCYNIIVGLDDGMTYSAIVHLK